MRLRNLISRRHFKTRRIEGLKCYAVSGLTPLAEEINQYFSGVLDAIKHRYLKEFLIIIDDGSQEENRTIERYSLKFLYEDENNAPDECIGRSHSAIAYRGPEVVRIQFSYIIKRIVALTATLEPLPTHSKTIFKLTYYDERTPLNYEPHGFTSSDGTYFFKEHQKECLKLGRLIAQQDAFNLDVESIFIRSASATENELLDHFNKLANNSADSSVHSTEAFDCMNPLTATWRVLDLRKDLDDSTKSEGETNLERADIDMEPAAELAKLTNVRYSTTNKLEMTKCSDMV
ncbi:hypothetical protein AB6A40_001750 [Gnathostoma spinigerum]|uniref:HORMA domain-containing protein n=1 Tax=Gnathostoma spinigerum TaxID=75299 RepID=A0ABD6ECD1_9BILA